LYTDGVRLALAILALAVGDRTETDAQVAKRARVALEAYRDAFNKGDMAAFGDFYLEDASLHASLGPAKDALKQVAGLSDPAVYHGREAIQSFWNSTTISVGLKTMKAYDHSGRLEPTLFVVDDNTVVVAGLFSFNKIYGQSLSETWVRSGDSWKLKSHLLKIDGIMEGETLIPPTKTIQGNTTNKLAAPAGVTKDMSQPSGFFFMGIMVLATCAVAGFLLRRSKRRREAAIAGFEVMLG